MKLHRNSVWIVELSVSAETATTLSEHQLVQSNALLLKGTAGGLSLVYSTLRPEHTYGVQTNPFCVGRKANLSAVIIAAAPENRPQSSFCSAQKHRFERPAALREWEGVREDTRAFWWTAPLRTHGLSHTAPMVQPFLTNDAQTFLLAIPTDALVMCCTYTVYKLTVYCTPYFTA